MPQAPNYPYAPHVMQYTAAYHRIHISTELSGFYQSLSYFISYHILSQLTISYRTSLKMREEQILKRSALSPRERKGIHMKFYGMQKLSLLDFPGKMCATVFTGGCNYRCPFCHNSSLVEAERLCGGQTIDGEEVIRFLRRREGILEGIAITGGEPTLWGEQLVSFIRKVKEQTDMLVKLDTNGTHPDVLRECIAAGIDYVAMDIKSSEERYHIVAGHADTRLDKVKESISILLGGEVDYEFRTTAVKPLHTAEDFNGIGQLISGAKRYFIQCYKDSGDILIESDEAAAEYERSAVGTAELGAYSKDELESFLAIAKKYIPTAELRGVD